MPVVEAVARAAGRGSAIVAVKAKGDQNGPCLNGVRLSAVA